MGIHVRCGVECVENNKDRYASASEHKGIRGKPMRGECLVWYSEFKSNEAAFEVMIQIFVSICLEGEIHDGR